jgi:hypothetical protein
MPAARPVALPGDGSLNFGRMTRFRSLLGALGAAAALALLQGCQSPWVQATVVNDEETPVKLVEVNYPGGSFGVQTIAPHSSFHYRFHILTNDQSSIEFTDSAGHANTVKGPELEQGEEGTLTIEIRVGDHVVWAPHLAARR